MFFENFPLFVIVISRTTWGQSDDDIYIYFFFVTSFWHFSFYCLSVKCSATNLDTIMNVVGVIAQTYFILCKEF